MQESSTATTGIVSVEKDGWRGQSATIGVTDASADAMRQSLSAEPEPSPTIPEGDPSPADTAAPEGEEPPVLETEDGAPAKPDARPKLDRGTRRVNKIQAEISALTKLREDTRRAFEAEERERAARRLAPAEPAPKTPVATAEPDGDAPTWEQYDADGKTFNEFQRDLTAHITARAVRDATAAVQKDIHEGREAAQTYVRQEKWQQSVAATRAAHADFDTVIAEVADLEIPFVNLLAQFHPDGPEIFYELGQAPELAEKLTDLQPTRPVMDALRFSEKPAALLLHLASLGAPEMERLARLHPAAQIRALSVMEAAVTGAKHGSPGPARTTHANPPIQPVARGARTAGEAEPLTQVRDFNTFFKRANAEDDRRRRA